MPAAPAFTARLPTRRRLRSCAILLVHCAGAFFHSVVPLHQGSPVAGTQNSVSTCDVGSMSPSSAPGGPRGLGSDRPNWNGNGACGRGSPRLPNLFQHPDSSPQIYAPAPRADASGARPVATARSPRARIRATGTRQRSVDVQLLRRMARISIPSENRGGIQSNNTGPLKRSVAFIAVPRPSTSAPARPHRTPRARGGETASPTRQGHCRRRVRTRPLLTHRSGLFKAVDSRRPST